MVYRWNITGFPISTTWFYKKEKIVGTGVLYWKIFNKWKEIVYNSKFLILKADALYLFEKFRKKIQVWRNFVQSSKASQTTDARSQLGLISVLFIFRMLLLLGLLRLPETHNVLQFPVFFFFSFFFSFFCQPCPGPWNCKSAFLILYISNMAEPGGEFSFFQGNHVEQQLISWYSFSISIRPFP